jgi:hypothetical protein
MFLLQLGELGDEFALIVIIIHRCFLTWIAPMRPVGWCGELSPSGAPVARRVQRKEADL